MHSLIYKGEGWYTPAGVPPCWWRMHVRTAKKPPPTATLTLPTHFKVGVPKCAAEERVLRDAMRQAGGRQPIVQHSAIQQVDRVQMAIMYSFIAG